VNYVTVSPVELRMNQLKIIWEAWVSDLLPLFFVACLGCFFARRLRLIFLGWLVAYIVIDDVIALTPIIFHWNFGRWNWIGQTASGVFSLVLAKKIFSDEEIGLCLPRSKRQVIWTVVGVLGALANSQCVALA